MSIIKRCISLLLILVLVIRLQPMTAQAGELDGGFQYNIYEDYVVITGFNSNDTMVVIPEEIENLPVTHIGYKAFNHCYWLTSINIPNSVTSIGEEAFKNCYSLTSINISDGITVIGDWAFYRCESLESINIPGSITSIGEYVFSGCSSLTSINLPDSVTYIGYYAFSGCESLTNINIPDGVTCIDYAAFASCDSLIRINLPDSLTYIGDYAFVNCDGLSSVTIPKQVTYIGDNAFYQCKNVTSIYFEGDVPFLGEDVFYGITACAYYPTDNPTWTAEIMNDYGGDITWIPYNPNHPFTDVPMDSFYEEPIVWALKNGITNGATTTTFNPGGACLRAHVVTFLHRAAGNPDPTSSNNPFTDVKSGDFFYKPVLWAVEKGITNGTSATTFGSYANCNRAAVVTFLWRAAGSPEPESTNNPFEDVKDTDFFYKPVLWAVEKGITNGVDTTHFGPGTDCNRAQVVTFLYRAYN